MHRAFKFTGILLFTFTLLSCYITSTMDLDTENKGSVSFQTFSEAGENKEKLFNYLENVVWQKKTLSGQMDLTWDDSVDMLEKVYKDTGKYPAISGYDFMNIGNNSGSGQKQTQEAVNWWKNAKGTGKKGIVTFCWHWRSPDNAKEFYTDKTSYRIPYNTTTKKWKTDTVEYTKMLADLDRVAKELQILQQNGVPVLWRPLHEAAGKWFWWGASGSDAYKALYIFMYDYFTNTKKLDNLIWVWNGQSSTWYPGDKYVDIVSEDIYEQKNYGSQSTKFDLALQYSNSDKMVALSENGTIPDPDNMKKDKAMWLWFMTWNDGLASGTDDNNFWEGEAHNPETHKKKVYNHQNIITLEQLPEF